MDTKPKQEEKEPQPENQVISNPDTIDEPRFFDKKNHSYLSGLDLMNLNNKSLNSSFDSNFSGNSFHSQRNPHRQMQLSTNFSMLLQDLAVPDTASQLFNLNTSGSNQGSMNVNFAPSPINTAPNQYSSFSPFRPQKQSTFNHSNKNLNRCNFHQYPGSSTFVRCNSNNVHQNKPQNIFNSPFSCHANANSNANGNTFSNLINNINNSGIIHSPVHMRNHNDSLNLLGGLSNSFTLNPVSTNSNREYFTPQYQKKSKKKNVDIPRNKIHLETILRLKEKRTTIMIRNIPNKYTLKLFSDEINASFYNKYDVLFLPVDGGNHCNLGYGFINFIDPIHIIAFYDKYCGKKWENFNSDKICELAYAKIQGKEELLKHITQRGICNTNLPVYLVNDNIDKKNVKIELPIKYLQAFLKFYPYSLYTVSGYDKFVVDSFYNF